MSGSANLSLTLSLTLIFFTYPQPLYHQLQYLSPDSKGVFTMNLMQILEAKLLQSCGNRGEDAPVPFEKFLVCSEISLPELSH